MGKRTVELPDNLQIFAAQRVAQVCETCSGSGSGPFGADTCPGCRGEGELPPMHKWLLVAETADLLALQFAITTALLDQAQG